MIILFRYTALGNLSKERKYNEKKMYYISYTQKLYVV